MRLKILACVSVWVLSTMPAAAQVRSSEQARVDIGLMLGWTSASDAGGVLQFRRATTYQATFNLGIWSTSGVAVSLEVPFLASPAFEVANSGSLLPKEYASLYLTPGVRVTTRAARPVSIFGAVGAGYARYSESKTHLDGSPNPDQRDTNTGAIQFGGGVDVGALRWLGFRAEVRDVYTGARKFSIATPGARVHNLVGSGGFVLRF